MGLLALAGLALTHLSALAAEDPWKPWIEPDFPFFSSGLDLRPQYEKTFELQMEAFESQLELANIANLSLIHI